uniref:MAPK regulated corepressor interacting protein 2 n=1 Tax=Acanthochromis polyacanthus TaxID=80966 RepID=A0A3Q1EX24_9TELE
PTRHLCQEHSVHPLWSGVCIYAHAAGNRSQRVSCRRRADSGAADPVYEVGLFPPWQRLELRSGRRSASCGAHSECSDPTYNYHRPCGASWRSHDVHNHQRSQQTGYTTEDSSPPPKIVFNRPNGKRYHSAATPKAETSAEGFTPAHEENVRFVYEVWQEVEQKLEDRDGGESANSQGPVQYTEKTPSTAMKNFVPIDLEEWWAQRFLANIANLS